MRGVAVVTDSLSCLPRAIAEQYGIQIVPINIVCDGKVYRDYVDLDPSQAYELFLQNPESFTTSPATPAQFVEAMHKAHVGGKDVLCITVSKKLSTEYNVACLAAEKLAAGPDGPTVRVIDSETVTAAEGLVALAAAREAVAGADLASVVRVAERVRDNVSFALVLETIRHVYRTGRVPKIAAQAASVIPIKPILTSSSGVVKLVGMSRNMSQGIEHIIRSMKLKANGRQVHVAVMHAYAGDAAQKLKERIASEFNCAELWIAEVSPVVGYALGAGALGFAYYQEPVISADK